MVGLLAWMQITGIEWFIPTGEFFLRNAEFKVTTYEFSLRGAQRRLKMVVLSSGKRKTGAIWVKRAGSGRGRLKWCRNGGPLDTSAYLKIAPPDGKVPLSPTEN